MVTNKKASKIMDEKNPLQICPTPSLRSNSEDFNKAGRPAMNGVIKFGPQPRSIMAQMLAEIKTKPRPEGQLVDGLISIEDEPTGQNELAEEFEKTKSEESCSGAENKKYQSSHQQLVCDFPKCSYCCKLSSNLIKHKRVHTNEKPYLCEKCSFRTNFVNSLKTHKRLHTSEKPYQCGHCNYRCNSSSNLKKHFQLRHTDGNKCKYKRPT